LDLRHVNDDSNTNFTNKLLHASLGKEPNSYNTLMNNMDVKPISEIIIKNT